MITYRIRALTDATDKTIYRIVERRNSCSEWMVTLPCLDYDLIQDAEYRLKQLTSKNERPLKQRAPMAHCELTINRAATKRQGEENENLR
jgi:hypothetical protein